MLKKNTILGKKEIAEYLSNKNKKVKKYNIELIIQKFCTSLQYNLLNLTKSKILFTLDEKTEKSFSKIRNKNTNNFFIIVFTSKYLKKPNLIIIEEKNTSFFVDILLGIKKDTKKEKTEKKITSIEKGIIKILGNTFLNSLSTAFEDIQDIDFHLDKIVSDVNFAIITEDDQLIQNINISFRSTLHKGLFSLIIPNENLIHNSIQSKNNTQDELTEKKIWQEKLVENIKKTNMTLKATIEGNNIKNLSDLLNLKIGSTIIIGSKSTIKTSLAYKNNKILEGLVGEEGGNITIIVKKLL